MCVGSYVFLALNARHRWPRVWQYAGHTMHLAVALHLETLHPSPKLSFPAYDTIISPLPPPANQVEDEIRRNCFWLAYGVERMNTMSSGWNCFMDEKWITQALPAVEEDLWRAV